MTPVGKVRIGCAGLALTFGALSVTACDAVTLYKDGSGTVHQAYVVAEEELASGIGNVEPPLRLDVIMSRVTPRFGRTPQERCADFGGTFRVNRGVQLLCEGIDY